MALFPWSKKKDGDSASPVGPGAGGGAGGAAGGSGAITSNGGSANASGAGGDSEFEYSPAKAEKFFHWARSRAETGSFDYAANMWLSGLRFDPANMEAVEGFMKAANAMVEGGTRKPPKELTGVVDGKTGVHKFLSALLDFGFAQRDSDAATKVASLAGDLGLREPAMKIAPIALQLALNNPKTSKGQYVKLISVFTKSDAYDFAARAGEAALKLDPTDQQLSADLKNFAAQSTMNKGGFENTGKEGGFRSNVKDLEGQRKLEESERTVKSEEVQGRVIAAAKADYDGRPLDKPMIIKYVKALLDRSLPADQEQAHAVLTKAHADTQDFNFRKIAGELRIKQGRQKLKELLGQRNANPADAGIAAQVAAAEKAQIELEIVEFDASVKAYPNDLGLKFELGRRLSLAGRYTEAIAQFQLAKNDGRYKLQASAALAECFKKIDWLDESIETYRAAIDAHPVPNDDTSLELRYGLMDALQRRATENSDLASAEEAEKFCSAIAMVNIQYRDVADRKRALKAMIQQLKAGA